MSKWKRCETPAPMSSRCRGFRWWEEFPSTGEMHDAHAQALRQGTCTYPAMEPRPTGVVSSVAPPTSQPLLLTTNILATGGFQVV